MTVGGGGDGGSGGCYYSASLMSQKTFRVQQFKEMDDSCIESVLDAKVSVFKITLNNS